MMARIASPLVFVFSLCLIGAQLGGLHMHVGSHGYNGTPHATHSHTGGSDPHDHEHDKDVNILELGTTAPKYLFFLLVSAFSIAAAFVACAHAVPGYTYRPRTACHRWRPPLRAPPPSLASTA